MSFDFLPPRHQLVTVMKRIYQNEMTTLSGGNLSILDDDGSIWITPAGIEKGKLTPQDIIHVHPDGTMAGQHRPSSELPFHRAIYARRPDVRAIVHAHPPALVAFSIARQVPDTRIIPQARLICGQVGYAPYALPGSEALGETIAGTFAQGFNVVLLENHGVAVAGPDLLTAFQRLETMDFCARALIKARSLGAVKQLSDAQMELFDRTLSQLPEFTPGRPLAEELEQRQKVAEMVHRACERYLMISTEGVLSARVSANSFVITPTGVDRQAVTAADLVLIQDGRREAGKLPSRSVRLHEAIYRRYPEAGSVILSQASNIVAFAITEKPFDTKTIPESYVMLRDVPRLPYGAQFQDPERIAASLSSRSPVLLIQNDCIILRGKTVTEAFDRLEVAEYTAKSVIDSAAIGPLVPIGEQEILDLRQALSLD